MKSNMDIKIVQVFRKAKHTKLDTRKRKTDQFIIIKKLYFPLRKHPAQIASQVNLSNFEEHKSYVFS